VGEHEAEGEAEGEGEGEVGVAPEQPIREAARSIAMIKRFTTPPF